MSLYQRILCPIDFDDNSLAALNTAADLARRADGTVYVLHVVPMIVQPTAMPVYVDIYKSQEETAWARLREIARKELAGVKYELMVKMGEPAGCILRAERKVDAHLVVMATHARRGFAHFFLGSVAEAVLRQATCPVLTIRGRAADKHVVGAWMTHNPVVATIEDKLASVEAKMHEGDFRALPVLKDGVVIGIITDRDVRRFIGKLDATAVKDAMTEHVLTVRRGTPIAEAARLLRERKIGGLPVVEGDKLVGMITVTDVLQALTENESE
ncbi:MAG TPA: universal stress protein [Candidatus Binataceae bacterium]|nr:universal stress protein [Candidatus Binataceae bacterium]